MSRRMMEALVGLGATLALPVGKTAGSADAGERRCLVLADGYVSEYAWGKYQETTFPWDHPGHDFCVRGLLDQAGRFHRWLANWQVQRIDLERYSGPLRLEGVDLVILDEVRQSVCDPYETTLAEFVRGGGGLLVYAGFWGLGGCPRGEYNADREISSFQHSPLGEILPVEIQATPDLEMLNSRPPPARTPVFVHLPLGSGIEDPKWEIWGLHLGRERGEVLATLDGKPLIVRGTWGQGQVVVYTGDDLAWVRAGVGSHIHRFAGTLWRRLAALTVGDTAPVPAREDPSPTWDLGPAFAHPDQPMNFLWGGYFYYRTPEMERLWARDLVTHSATLFSSAPEVLGEAGIQSWESLGCPLQTPASAKDPQTWMVDSEGEPIAEHPCYNNPQALEYMDQFVAQWAEKLRDSPAVAYGHLGDETQFDNCYCSHCQEAFREKWGYEMPPLRDDFSAPYLDQWIDYLRFKNEAIGRMYARAARVAREKKPGLKMFASLPQSGGMAHGDDQLHTQSGFDLLWDHTYPGTMVIRVGLNASLMEETAFLQGRPEVPLWDLLQGFDSYDRVPHVPPPEYIREMVWQAIAHGVDSVGWFVYNAFFWNLPGSEAWEEAGRLAREVLSPLTPTLYQMRNVPQPIGLLYSYSQEAVDGLKEQVWPPENPWKGVIRWWTLHATQEAYEVLKYAHIPFNVVSEHRLFLGHPLPWKVILIPYVQHLHAKSREALAAFMAQGGTVYVGADSELDLPGVRKLSVSFDTKFTTWWPRNRKEEWNHRRVRAYLISPFLEKARRLRPLLGPYCEEPLVKVEDPEVIYHLREAGEAKYLFFINDHQINPTSPEMRRKRGAYNHFMLMPMEFPPAQTQISVQGPGYLYPLLPESGEPIRLRGKEKAFLSLNLEGGGGQVFLLLPEKVDGIELIAPPVRTPEGVAVRAQVLGEGGVLSASLPLQLDLEAGEVKQTVYATTQQGELNWTVPLLREFPEGSLAVTVTDLASGKSDQRRTHMED